MWGKKIFLIVCVFSVVLGTFNILYAGQEQISIKVACDEPDVHPSCLYLNHFKELVEDATNNRINVMVYCAAQLAKGDTANIQAVQSGAVQVTEAFTGAMSQYVPEYAANDLPFLFRDYAHVDAVFQGPIGQRLNNKFLAKTGIRVLGYYGYGFKGFYNSKRPIKVLDDFKGLKMRVHSSPVSIKAMGLYGAQAVPLAFPEFYGAMQQGVVDGGENAKPTYYTAKHCEVATYFSRSNHVYSAGAMLINEKFFQGLSENDKKIIEAAGILATAHMRKIYRKMDDELEDKLKQGGSKFNDLAPGTREALVKAVQPLYDNFPEKMGGKKFVEEIINTK